MNELNEQPTTSDALVVVKLSKSDDKVCQTVLHAARLLGHGTFPNGIHMTVQFSFGEADLTGEGVGLYEPTNYWNDEDCLLFYAFPYKYHYLSWTLAESLALAGVKMYARDLVRVGLGRMPVRPVCTTFVALLLGLGVTNAMPLETLARIINFYPMGELWIRNEEDNNDWIAVDKTTFFLTT